MIPLVSLGLINPRVRKTPDHPLRSSNISKRSTHNKPTRKVTGHSRSPALYRPNIRLFVPGSSPPPHLKASRKALARRSPQVSACRLSSRKLRLSADLLARSACLPLPRPPREYVASVALLQASSPQPSPGISPNRRRC